MVWGFIGRPFDFLVNFGILVVPCRPGSGWSNCPFQAVGGSMALAPSWTRDLCCDHPPPWNQHSQWSLWVPWTLTTVFFWMLYDNYAADVDWSLRVYNNTCVLYKVFVYERCMMNDLRKFEWKLNGAILSKWIIFWQSKDVSAALLVCDVTSAMLAFYCLYLFYPWLADLHQLDDHGNSKAMTDDEQSLGVDSLGVHHVIA